MRNWDRIVYRPLAETELTKASSQLTASYKSAYAELMDEAYLSSLTEGHWVALLQNSLSSGDTCMVALDDGKIAGTAVFGKNTICHAAQDALNAHEEAPDEEAAELRALYLLPQYTGHGVGRGLYCELEKRMHSQGYKGCVLEVLSSNQQAIRFYTANGFHKTSSFTVEENGMTLQCDVMKKMF